ncbi:MFS transporter [Arthrobacter sp. NPDC090010]|uniref:MFS transporter n=1 Tax=Arthrobacter sp. NPDC090010 TaxID=3363942 RepID=UPI00381A8C02
MKATALRRAPFAIPALALGITMLVASEFLPASVLPLIATELRISDGTAGLAVAATALAGALTAPSLASLVPRTDRRRVLIILLGVGTAANVLVAVAPSFPVLLLGRLALGVAIAGYWSLAFGAGVQILPSRPALVSTALATGTSIATIVAMPLAAIGGTALGWRQVFWAAAVVGVLATLTLALTLPSVPAHPSAGFAMMRRALGHRRLMLGIVCVGLAAFANFTAYPYIRLAIETVDPGAMGWLLLLWGAGGLVGNILAGAISRRLRLAVSLGPFILAASLLLASQSGTTASLTVASLAWGLGFNLVPVTTQLWVTTVEPDDAEAAVSLQVTAFQTAITLGAVVGGLLLDHSGLAAVFLTAATAAVLGGVGFAALPAQPAEARQRPGVVPSSAENARTKAASEV